MKILVFGGCGFLGEAIVNRLMESGHEVGIYDIRQASVKGASSFIGNVIDDANLAEIIKCYDMVIYLISAIMPKQSMDEPLSSYSTDIPLIIKTLDTCRTVGIKRVIYSSSGGTIYGNSNQNNAEDSVEYPINHYGICKLTCEKILLQYNELYGMENVILRISNPYGINQRIGSGVGVIMALATSAIKNGTIRIWGDGNVVRDFVSVRDVANAFELACVWRCDTNCVPVFNIGSGEGHSINDISNMIVKSLDYPVEITHEQGRAFDVKRNVLDTSKARKYLGFIPEKKSEQGIADFIVSLKKKHDKESNVE